MDEISLSESESRFYSELFLCYDEEKTGKIPKVKASELYHSANISNEKILEISYLAGIPDTAFHVSRLQFYACLKLIAAHQASLPLRPELITAAVPLPLPRFSWIPLSNNSTEITNKYQQKHAIMRHTKNVSDPVSPQRNSSTSHPSQMTTPTSNMHNNGAEIEARFATYVEPDSASVISDGVIIKNQRSAVSPEAWSTNSDSPTPTNSVAELSWKKKMVWHGLLGDEHRQLLGTEEESSDRHSSDEENEADLETVYQITSEQREYYFKQFNVVQHDPNGLVSGQVARVFFEKSRIPIEELRHIWQLCDVSRDGALSLAEFTAAMHLVVLRRNHIPLPAVLPACLHPSVLQHNTSATIHTSQTDPPEADLLHLDDDEEVKADNGVRGTTKAVIEAGASMGSRQGTNALVSNPRPLTPSKIAPPPTLKLQSGLNKSLTPSAVHPSQFIRVSNPPKAIEVSALTYSPPPITWTKEVQPNQWTQFNASPTSNISSPGPKPVNFDMQRTAQAVVSDPQILHPVPLRVTPIAPAVTDNQSVELHDVSVVTSNSSTKSSSISSHYDSLQNNDLRAIQRPQAKKLTAKTIGGIPPPPHRVSATGGNVNNTISDKDTLETFVSECLDNNLSTSMVVNKKDIPPLPPPRPHRHGRSNSLDLNKFKIGIQSNAHLELMAQASSDIQTSTGFADFTHFPDDYNTIKSQKFEQMSLCHSQILAGGNIQTISEPQPPIRLALQSNQRVSAFEIYRKPNSLNSESPTLLSANQAISGGSSIGPVAITTLFGSVAATTMTMTTSELYENSEVYEKKVNAISEALRHFSVKQEHNNNVIEVLRRLSDQNNILLRLCNDLSDELLTTQARKEEMRIKLEATMIIANLSSSASGASVRHNGGVIRTGSSISAPVTANITGGSICSVHSNI